MTRQIVLDTETTGLEFEKGHRIIEIGCIEIINRQITGKNFQCYINPERAIDYGAVKIHGITETFLADKPKFVDIVHELLAFIKDAELIIHNAPFDIGFLNGEFSLLQTKLGAVTDYCKVIDTLAMARELHPGQRNSLDAVCKRYGVDNSHRNLHGALLDAELLALAYLAMTSGQNSLFTDNEDITNSATTKNEAALLLENIIDLPVIYATAEELKAHEASLGRLVKKF